MITVEIKENGKVVGILLLTEKEFKTGSRGFFGNTKVVIGGRKYQAQAQLVEIGSKEIKDEKK